MILTFVLGNLSQRAQSVLSKNGSLGTFTGNPNDPLKHWLHLSAAHVRIGSVLGKLFPFVYK